MTIAALDAEPLPLDRRIVSSGCGCVSIPSMNMGIPCRWHREWFPVLYIVTRFDLIRYSSIYIQPESNIILGYN